MPKLAGTLTAVFSAVSKPIATGSVTGDANPRVQLDAGGRISWGPGSGASDVNLNRSGTGVVTLTGSLTVSSNVVVTGTLTDGTLAYVRMASGGGTKIWVQTTDPGASASNGDIWLVLP